MIPPEQCFLAGLVVGVALYHVVLASLAQRARRPGPTVLPSEDIATAWRRSGR